MELARNDLETFWAALNTQGSPIAVKDALLDFFPELISAYGDAAGLLAADFYDETRSAPPSAKRFQAALSGPVDTDQADASARWALGPLFSAEPDPTQVLLNLSGLTQRLVLQPGRSTVIRSASRDPSPRGFARIPVGKTCRFCTMVASRGFVYSTARSAGESNHWHNDCDCIVVAGNSKDDLPEDYNLDALVRSYAAGEGTPA